jgi:hypothetical protein
LVGNREIDLALKDVDARYENTQLVAHRKAAARLPADQTSLGRVEGIEIVG